MAPTSRHDKASLAGLIRRYASKALAEFFGALATDVPSHAVAPV